MLNQMVKWTLLISLWRKYKHHVFVTFVCFVALVLTTLFHQDFVEYNEKVQTPYLATSYFVKWSIYVVCLLCYWFAIRRINKAAQFDSTLHSMMKQKNNRPDSQSDSSSAIHSEPTSPSASDPFAQIRTKKSLRSKADFVIEQDSEHKPK